MKIELFQRENIASYPWNSWLNCDFEGGIIWSASDQFAMNRRPTRRSALSASQQQAGQLPQRRSLPTANGIEPIAAYGFVSQVKEQACAG